MNDVIQMHFWDRRSGGVAFPVVTRGVRMSDADRISLKVWIGNTTRLTFGTGYDQHTQAMTDILFHPERR